MTVGDVQQVPGHPDLHYVDTGMYDTAGYGAVYILESERPAVIETGIGTNVDRIVDAIETVGVEPAAICVTHVHLDHVGGAGFLAREYPEATIYAHERGVPHLIDPERLIEGTKQAVGDQWQYYVEPEPVPEDRITAVTDGDSVELGDRRLRAHHTPGHAPHQVVFEEATRRLAFTADAAGIYLPAIDRVQPTTPPPQFDLDAALADVDTLAALEPETLCFTHFGPSDEPDRLLSAYKRTLVEWVEAVRQRREAESDDESVLDHFADTVHHDVVDTLGEEKARAEARLNTRGVLAYLDRAE